MTSVTIRSYAKLNIALDVLDERPDGYHNIESVIQMISLCDHLTVSTNGRNGVRIEVDAPNVPADSRNLAYRACVMFLEAAGLTDGVDIRLQKNIPVQAGLGGGSSNAAAAVMALSELFDHPLGKAELNRICASLGSDVPFFLTGGTAFVEGRGEVVKELPDCPLDYVVIKPNFGISTAWAYSRFQKDRTPSYYSRAAADACRRGDRDNLVRSMGSDFTSIAEESHPEIDAIRGQLLEAGADGAMLAGSGSAVFGVFLDSARCDRAYSDLKQLHGQTYRAQAALRKELQPIER